MSSAQNHKTRSRRGYYKTKAFYGRRAAVVTPSIHKKDYFSLFKMLRKFRRSRETSSDIT